MYWHTLLLYTYIQYIVGMQYTTLDAVSPPFPWHQPLQHGPLPPPQDSLPLQSTCRTKGPSGCWLVTGGFLGEGFPPLRACLKLLKNSTLPSEQLGFTSTFLFFEGPPFLGGQQERQCWVWTIIIRFTFGGPGHVSLPPATFTLCGIVQPEISCHHWPSARKSRHCRIAVEGICPKIWYLKFQWSKNM